MASRKLRVAVICGGKSAEHEVSLASARNVVRALDPDRYELRVIVLDRQGRLLAAGSPRFLEEGGGAGALGAAGPGPDGQEVALVGAAGAGGEGASLVALAGAGDSRPVDVVFPVMHGTDGEDGSIQGLARLANVAVVGASVLGSAVNMDKEVMKRLLREAGLPVPRFLVAERWDRRPPDFERVAGELGCPLFVKPSNLGSSVGISKIHGADEFTAAVELAFAYDTKLLFEEAVAGRELECAVLGTEDPRASVPGEILTAGHHEFYSYDAKYRDERGAALAIPAELPPATVEEVRRLAVRAFRATCCEGMARVDFFLRPGGELLVNELNTIPGFTDISMYPKLWEASGVPVRELLDLLIEDAVRRFERRRRLRTRVD